MFSTTAFSLVTGRCFSLNKPTIIPHHCGIKMPLISFLLSADFLVKPFTVFNANSLEKSMLPSPQCTGTHVNRNKLYSILSHKTFIEPINFTTIKINLYS